jgi:hypothetical protein
LLMGIGIAAMHYVALDLDTVHLNAPGAVDGGGREDASLRFTPRPVIVGAPRS